MLMLLAKEVAEKQPQIDFEWIKILIEGVVTLGSVFIGAILAYLFSRRANKQSQRDDAKRKYVLELHEMLIKVVDEYVEFKPLVRNSATVLLSNHDMVDRKKEYDDFLNIVRMITFKKISLNVRFLALENIDNVDEIKSNFVKFNMNLEEDIRITNETIKVIYETQFMDPKKLDTLYKQLETATTINNIDLETYQLTCYAMQQFMFKK